MLFAVGEVDSVGHGNIPFFLMMKLFYERNLEKSTDGGKKLKYEMSQRVCVDCGGRYLGGSKSHYCQRCRGKRQSGWAKAHGLNRMGNEAHSRKCAEDRKNKEEIIK